MKISTTNNRQQGLSLIEMLVAMALSVTIMSGVVSVLVVSKGNFITERELATLQENARFAIKFLSDEIRMAGYSGCNSQPLYYANSVNGGDSSWYLNGTGLQGFENEAGLASFPIDFRPNVAANTDAIVVRRGDQSGLRIDGNHNPNSANMPLNKEHDIQPGTIMVVSTPDCQQVGIFQVSGPTNNSNNAERVVHNTGASIEPGNCTKDLAGNFDCSDESSSSAGTYPPGSSVMRLRSEAFYIGASSVGNGIPALFRMTLGVDVDEEATELVAEELVQGIENIQVLYGLDNALNDGIADIYLKANSGSMNWSNVVSVRLFLRMRSNYEVYNSDQAYATFQGVAGTNGSDRFMRQIVSTTIQLRN